MAPSLSSDRLSSVTLECDTEAPKEKVLVRRLRDNQAEVPSVRLGTLDEDMSALYAAMDLTRPEEEVELDLANLVAASARGACSSLLNADPHGVLVEGNVVRILAKDENGLDAQAVNRFVASYGQALRMVA